MLSHKYSWKKKKGKNPSLLQLWVKKQSTLGLQPWLTTSLIEGQLWIQNPVIWFYLKLIRHRGHILYLLNKKYGRFQLMDYSTGEWLSWMLLTPTGFGSKEGNQWMHFVAYCIKYDIKLLFEMFWDTKVCNFEDVLIDLSGISQKWLDPWIIWTVFIHYTRRKITCMNPRKIW